MAFDIAAVTCRSILLQDGERQHVLFHSAGRALQLCVSGASILQPVSLFANLLGRPETFRVRLNSLRALNDLMITGELPARDFPPDPRSRRLSTVLHALDGRLAGLSDRQIAVTLFGEDRVRADWKDPRGHLRDQVRRAVRRGRFLMQGGYLDLLP